MAGSERSQTGHWQSEAPHGGEGGNATASEDERHTRLPPGYRLEAAGEGLLALVRTDGSVVALFEFSAFGPTPDRIRDLAEEDLRTLRGDEQN